MVGSRPLECRPAERIRRVEAWRSLNKFQLQVPKCKELLIQFKKLRSPFPSVYTASGNLELVLHAKILGVTISDNLKWNKHRLD
jgi:hypothetical protein